MAQGHHLSEIDVQFACGEATVHCVLPGCNVKASSPLEIFAEAFRRVLWSSKFHTCRTSRRLGEWLVVDRAYGAVRTAVPGLLEEPVFQPEKPEQLMQSVDA